MACREPRLRYTSCEAQTPVVLAMACREPRLRYTHTSPANCQLLLWLAGNRGFDTLRTSGYWRCWSYGLPGTAASIHYGRGGSDLRAAMACREPRLRYTPGLRGPAPLQLWLAGNRGFDTLTAWPGLRPIGYGLPGTAASIHSQSLRNCAFGCYGLPGTAASIHF